MAPPPQFVTVRADFQMNEEIQTLVDSLRRGQYEDPTAKIELLIAALQEHRADDAVLLSLLRSPQIPLRLAAVSACRGRLNGELAPELLKLVCDQEARVRRKVAEVLERPEGKAQIDALETLAQDSDAGVRLAAVKSSGGTGELRELQES